MHRKLHILAAGIFLCALGLLQAAEASIRVIDTPVVLRKTIHIPADQLLVIREKGVLRQGGGGRLVIEGNFIAPARNVFQDFQPGEIVFANPAAAPHALPQWWGARADGRADDTNAIQCALDAGLRKIYFPAGKYQITRPLNATDRPGEITLEGAGMSLHASYNGTFLVGNTGDTVLDTSGTQCFTMSNMSIVSGDRNPSQVGILFQRTRRQNFCQFSSLQNVSIHLAGDLSANGGNGTVAVYNNAAELWRASNVVLVADVALAIVGDNIFHIKSRYAEHFPDFTSNSECSIDGASSLIGRGGAALVVQNLASLELNNTYLNRWGKTIDSTETGIGKPYAIEVIGMLNFARLSGHQEGYPGLLHCRGVLASADINYSSWRIATDRPAILLDGRTQIAGIHSSTIRYNNNNPKDIPHPLIASTGERISGLSENSIWLFRHQSLSVRGGRISGNLIRADFRNPKIDLIPTEELLSYQLMTPAGIVWAGPFQQQNTTAEPRKRPENTPPLQQQVKRLFGGTAEE